MTGQYRAFNSVFVTTSMKALLSDSFQTYGSVVRFLRNSMLLLILPMAGLVVADKPVEESSIDIGSRRELFVDRQLIDSLEGVRLEVQQPEPHEVVLTTDEPWEGNTSAYYTVFQDGDRYRMYYRGSHWDTEKKKATHREVTCYAESEDGIHWTKPDLGLFEFDGSKDNNIVWDGVGTHNFTPFKDTNPDCAPEARYKALGRGRSLRKGDRSSQHGLFAFQSPDGIHWKSMSDQPVITKGAFDSQNLAFYDTVDGVYREYHRWFNSGVRDIMVCTSDDFLNWTEPVGLDYTQDRREHLYTNAIGRYFRAPHLLIGFPTRYLPKEDQRVEPVLMSSRNGLHFDRWSDPVIPEDAPEDRRGNRSNYMAWGLVQLPGDKDRLTVYATEAYYTGPDSRVRRFTFRLDGFVAATADQGGGRLVTKPVTFQGNHLRVNYRANVGGSLRVAIEDANGDPILGYTLNDCERLKGDSVEHLVVWREQDRVGQLAGKPVRLVFEIEDANFYSFKFQ